jgi:hypothetical protein
LFAFAAVPEPSEVNTATLRMHIEWEFSGVPEKQDKGFPI